MSSRSDFLEGVKHITPLLAPLVALGIVVGVTATEAGIPPIQTVAMGVLMNSPLSTVTAVELIDAGTPAPIVVLTAISVVFHFAILSLSIAPYFERLSVGWRWLLAFFLNTPNYALAMKQYEADSETDVRAYFLGLVVPFWVLWQASIIAGLVIGVGIPPAWEVEFVVPLVFIALVMGMVNERATAVAAVTAGVASLFAVGMPLNLGIIVGATVGVLAGLLLDRREVLER